MILKLTCKNIFATVVIISAVLQSSQINSFQKLHVFNSSLSSLVDMNDSNFPELNLIQLHGKTSLYTK